MEPGRIVPPNSVRLAVAAIGVWFIAAGCTSPQKTLRSGDGTVAVRTAPSQPIHAAINGTNNATFQLAVPRGEKTAAASPPNPVATQKLAAAAAAGRIQLAGALQDPAVRQQIPELADGLGDPATPPTSSIPGESGEGSNLSSPRDAEELSPPPKTGDGEEDDPPAIPADDPAVNKVLDVITEGNDGLLQSPASETDVQNKTGSKTRTPASPTRSNNAKVREGSEPQDAMHLDDVDVRKVLEILSREHGINILVSPMVNGRVTANLAGLSFDETLDAVLKSCNLVAQRENGVIYVYTAQEVASNNGNGNDAIGIRVYQLNYIRSTDLQGMIKPFLSAAGKMTSSPPSQVGIRQLVAPSTGGAAGGSGGGASGGGGGAGGGGGGGGASQSVTGGDSMAIGETVVIQDRESILVTLDQIILKLDVQPPQVLIEAVILSTTLNKDLELGVNFGVVDSAGQVLSVLGNGAALNAATAFLPQSVLQAGAGSVAGSGGATAPGLGAASPFNTNEHGIKFGFVDRNVTGFIRALEAVGNVEVLATPRLLVLNKQPAELLLGQRLGYAVASQSLVSTVQNVQFLNVGTLLRVRPSISSDGMVRMEIHPERSTGSVTNSIPSMTTSEVTTNILVPDGATVVIGGLMDNEDNQQHFGIPVLGRMPLIGPLFRERIRTQLKKELIVLLTVQICNPRPALVEGLAKPALEVPSRQASGGR